MGKNSHIQWTTDTFNPWAGCQRVSPACENCYAERETKHYGFVDWGPTTNGGQRRAMSEAYWKQPHKWNREARDSGELRRVFCASWADVFEDNSGPVVMDHDGSPAPEGTSLASLRSRLWRVIEQTPNLEWLLVTKRPENALAMLPPQWLPNMPANVWVGTTVENQKYADLRIPALAKIPARVRFLSVEPMIGPVDISAYRDSLNWVICGGESGPYNALRAIDIAWVRALRDQCAEFRIPFFFKQWGNVNRQDHGLVKNRQQDLRVLDGREHNAYPLHSNEVPIVEAPAIELVVVDYAEPSNEVATAAIIEGDALSLFKSRCAEFARAHKDLATAWFRAATALGDAKVAYDRATGTGHGKRNPQAIASFADAVHQEVGIAPRTVQHYIQLGKIADGAKEILVACGATQSQAAKVVSGKPTEEEQVERAIVLRDKGEKELNRITTRPLRPKQEEPEENGESETESAVEAEIVTVEDSGGLMLAVALGAITDACVAREERRRREVLEFDLEMAEYEIGALRRRVARSESPIVRAIAEDIALRNTKGPV